MTVIAYRAGIMAGDSCWSDGGRDGDYGGLITNSQNKLMRLPSGAVYGGAGATDDRSLIQLLAKVKTARSLPPSTIVADEQFAELQCLLALPDGTLWLINGGPEGNGVEPVSTEFSAVGTGAPIAIGAMARGATAEQAVRIACRWNVFCRPPIHKIKLERK
ncbi:MAG: hypothetical protein NTX56_04090 [Proteobacteria bacterium]|nr:hypothetical protein [Pseudomonadota bacterium]